MKQHRLCNVLFATLGATTGCAGGCGSAFNQHAQMMDAMRGVMKDAASRLGESGNGQIAAGGHVVNPGIRVSGGVEYFAVARYEGVGGQVQASMSGPLDRPVSAEVQAAADAIWRDASKSAEQKLQLLHEMLLESGTSPNEGQSAAGMSGPRHE
ncbi:hypothetical protein RAS2_27780 [Phycisphaerae bacterium RAS2]|nr:hypothetical protein RAS2_27780 [Phycisphaerae bacterium RAS2]